MHHDDRIPHFALSPSSGVPLYRQLMEAVRAEVASGRLAEGELLPSVRTVARELEINPMTVSKAWSHLESEGVVERVRGQGMRVASVATDGDPAERRRALLPAARELAARAYQLGLSPEETLAVLGPVLEEMRRD
ncbi:MAG TPA: GntR family transcriptional regulator [Candidatus Krumholzibacteria bacterium]|nr:GntR family transcriptional regulator [Candidatus Krumholzibacteria bacterium]